MRWALLPVFLLSVPLLAADADEDWKRLTALDAGPGKEPTTPQDALTISLGHMENQEKAYRAFLKDHPDDPRIFYAKLRLARLLSLRAELKDQMEPDEAERLIAEAELLSKTVQHRADIDFAKLTHMMRRWQGKRPGAEAKAEMLAGVRRFQQSHPKDPRVASLLLEVSTLFEGAITTKESLLREANRLTNNPGLKAQIADDLKRIGHLGKPLALKFTGLDGTAYDVQKWRGKPVLLIFFAAASEPARSSFREVKEALAPMGDAVVFAGVSLDAKREDAERFLADQKINIPVAWDGRGWNGEIALRLGINAVPSAWLLDQSGVVRTLDALEDPAALLKKLR